MYAAMQTIGKEPEGEVGDGMEVDLGGGEVHKITK